MKGEQLKEKMKKVRMVERVKVRIARDRHSEILDVKITIWGSIRVMNRL